MSPSIPRSKTDALVPQQPICVVADDVRVIREQFSKWLEEANFAVIHASCGAIALNAIRRKKPQLVVADIDMPHVSGLHLLQTIRRDPDKDVASVPVIISSSMEDSGVNKMVETLGGSAYLRKPVAKNRFLACIQAIFTGSKPDWESSGLPYQISSRFRRIISEIDA